MIVVNPVRDIWMSGSIIPGVAGLTGNAVNTREIIGPLNVIVVAGPGLAATTTVTFQGASEDLAALETPLAASWANIDKSGFCGAAVVPFTVTLDPAEAAYVNDGQMIIRHTLECPVRFVRAVLSAAGPISVYVAGKARRQSQV